MADRLTGPAALLLAVALGAAGWGAFGSAPSEREARLLIERYPAHVDDAGWERQMVGTCLDLRPWHEGYGRCRAVLREVGRDRLQRAAAAGLTP